MRIYFSGIGGVGIGPLAELAIGAGYKVVGSDLQHSPMTERLVERGVQVYFEQNGKDLQNEHNSQAIDLLVHSSAVTEGHPELIMAKNLGIPTAKRDGLIAKIVSDNQLKLVAVTGTHGKTTTTGMLVWTLKQLDVLVSYSVGAELSFGKSGEFTPGSQYFIYECDEFDRNFLHFSPFLSLITAIGYDHSDTYPTERDYKLAFEQFMRQSDYCLLWGDDLRSLGKPDIEASYEAYDELMDLSHITLAGHHNRLNAFLVERAVQRLTGAGKSAIVEAINSFPGTSRRFERIADGLYSDYGHHPDEIRETLQMASELSGHVVLVYQPHQNIRQHEVRDQYAPEVFTKASEVYWLPTYLSRENPDLEVLTPEQLTAQLDPSHLHLADLNDDLWRDVQTHLAQGHLVLCMGAGTIDGWVRKQANLGFN